MIVVGIVLLLLGALLAVPLLWTLGIVLVLVGAAFHVDETRDSAMLFLAAALQVLTSPVSGHLIGRAVYRSGYIQARVDAVDELAPELDQP